MALRQVLVFAVLLVLFLFLAIRDVSPDPYTYDEADYMSAARLGFAANWSDTPSISMADFLRAGLHRAGAPLLSRRIRGADDVLFYRHFHGPLFQYFLIPISRLGWSERSVRMALLVIPAASLGVIYFGCLALFRAPVALLASMLFLTSHSVLWSSELAPHQLFALCSLACLIFLMKAIECGRRAYWYGSAVAAALACCTLEVAFVLVLTVVICRWREGRKSLAASAAVFAATILAVWPAAILRLSLVKSYAAMVYLGLTRFDPWGHAGFLDTWRARIVDSPLEWALIAVALLLGFGNRTRVRTYPVAIFTALMLVVTLRVYTTTPRYSLTFVPALDLLAGLALLTPFGRLRRPASFAVVALAVAGLYSSAWVQATRRSHNSNPRSTAVLTYIHQKELENKALLVPFSDLPALHFYFPAMRMRGYAGQAPAESDRAGFAADAVIPAGKL